MEQDNGTMELNMHVQSMQATPHQDQSMSGNHISSDTVVKKDP